jgi:hypothetical protein
MQHRLKAAARAAWARVVTSEAFHELLVPVDDPVTPLDVSFAEGTPCDACSSAQKLAPSSHPMAQPPREAREAMTPDDQNAAGFRGDGESAVSQTRSRRLACECRYHNDRSPPEKDCERGRMVVLKLRWAHDPGSQL